MQTSKKYIRSFKKLTIEVPSFNEKIFLKVLILLGILTLIFFLNWFLRNVGNSYHFLFWLLIFAFFFRISRILILWYHYFFLDTSITTLDRKKIATVDVFTTYFPGEPKEMIKNTLLAMKEIKYPHNNYLCDEANDQELKKFCIENGITHIFRDNLIDAKAGNINNALKKSTGEFCFILDPDHVTHPELLGEIIPLFDQPDVGWVQIVQGYYNQENSMIAKAAAQQTYQFYGPMMIGMNKLGTVQALGANCCFRRSALESIGGHAAGLAEDLHTSMLLHAKGWRSIYLPKVLTRGLVPEDYHGYFKQQLKWSKGSFDLLFGVLPKIFHNLSLSQKIHYLFQPQYYLFGVMGLIEILIPILALFFQVVPLKIDIYLFFLMASPFLAFSMMIHLYVQNWVLDEDERGFHFVGGLIRNASWFIFILGLIFSVFKIDVKYLPTPKENKEGNQLIYVIPNIFVAALSLSAILYGLKNNLTPFSIFMAGFAGINFLIFSTSSLFAFPIFNLKRTKEYYRRSLLYPLIYIKEKLWLTRHFLYGQVRSLQKIIIITSISAFIAAGIIYLDENTRQDRKLITGDFYIYHSVNNDPFINTSVSRILVADSIPELEISHNQLTENQLLVLEFPEYDTYECAIQKILEGTYNKQLIRIAKIINQKNNITTFITVNFPINNYPRDLKPKVMNLSQKNTWYHIRELFKQAGCYKPIWMWPVLKNDISGNIPSDDSWDWLLIKTDRKNKKQLKEEIEFCQNKFQKPIILDFAEADKDISNEGLSILESFRISGTINFNENFSGKDIKKSFHTNDEITKIQYQQDFSTCTRESILPSYPIKGICYDPHNITNKEAAVLNRRRLESDFSKINAMGANYIRTYRTDIYMHNILKSAENNNLQLMTGFDLPGDLDYYADQNGVNELQVKILRKIRKYKDNKTIGFWNMGNDVLGNIDKYFAKPYNLKVKNTYLNFISNLCSEIYSITPEIPVVFSTAFNYEQFEFILNHLPKLHPNLSIGFDIFYDQHFQFLQKNLADDRIKSRAMITAFGPDGYWDALLTKNIEFDLPLEPSDSVKVNSYISKWNQYLMNKNLSVTGGFIYRWKENPQEPLTWMGITTINDIPKPSYIAIKSMWKDDTIPEYNFSREKYQIISTGLRYIPDINKRPNFSIWNRNNIIYGKIDERFTWVLTKPSDNNFEPLIFINTSNVQIHKGLSDGSYNMHLYILDSSGFCTTRTAPFVIFYF